jgi:hypothetical protein
MLNHQLSQKFKLIGNDEFNYLISILTNVNEGFFFIFYFYFFLYDSLWNILDQILYMF